MAKKNRITKKLKSEIELLKKQNNDLTSNNIELKNKINNLEDELNQYRNEDTNQLTPKEDFIISLPMISLLLIMAITITFISYKNESSMIGFVLAIISLIISLITLFYDFLQTILCISNPKSKIFIYLQKSMNVNISFFVSIVFAGVVLAVSYIAVKEDIDTSSSNWICSITLILYFLDILINKILYKLKANH